jgi:hypothetical protein
LVGFAAFQVVIWTAKYFRYCALQQPAHSPHNNSVYWSNADLLAAVKKRVKLADIDDGNRPSILVNKKGAC